MAVALAISSSRRVFSRLGGDRFWDFEVLEFPVANAGRAGDSSGGCGPLLLTHQGHPTPRPVACGVEILQPILHLITSHLHSASSPSSGDNSASHRQSTNCFPSTVHRTECITWQMKSNMDPGIATTSDPVTWCRGFSRQGVKSQLTGALPHSSSLYSGPRTGTSGRKTEKNRPAIPGTLPGLAILGVVSVGPCCRSRPTSLRAHVRVVNLSNSALEILRGTLPL